MKRIIDGVTYNTDTATAVARWDYVDDQHYDTEATVYQTRGGAYFIVHRWEVLEENKDPYFEPTKRQKTYFEAISREGLDRLILQTDNLTLLDDSLQDPPEAVAEPSPGATLFVRLPASLKDQIEVAAAAEKLSVNAWAMRCMERCVANQKLAMAVEAE